MLILVRHGESTLNAEGRLVGRLDPDLTELGERQAQAAGSMIGRVTEVRTSPLLRTRRTAALLGTEGPVGTDDRLLELDYGEFDGQPLSAIDPDVWRRWLDDAEFAPPGGESLADLGRRVGSLMDELFATDGTGARALEGDLVIVSHVSPIKAAVAWALDVDDLIAWRLRLSTGSVTRIGWGPRGAVLVSFNETPTVA